jgi:hypothetical protein
VPPGFHAELRCGEILKKREKAKGARLNGKSQDGKHRRSDHPTTDAPVKLSDLGITKNQSADWQRMAKDPEAVRKYIKRTARPTHRPRGSSPLKDRQRP